MQFYKSYNFYKINPITGECIERYGKGDESKTASCKGSILCGSTFEKGWSKKDGNGCLYRVLCVELLGGRADHLRKQNSNWANEGYFPDKICSWCAAGTDFDSSGDSEKAVHPLRWEEKP